MTAAAGAAVVMDPVTEDVVRMVPNTSAEDTDAAIAQAKAPLEAGNLSVNTNPSVRYSTPFGGFTEVKNVFIATDG
jgi:acyl-CoA reductase-like NAD-dependent aldehyde dehydrogenase